MDSFSFTGLSAGINTLQIEDHPLTFEMANLTLNKQVVIPDAADESDSNCSTSSGTRKSSRQKNAVDYVDLSLHKIKRRTIARPKKVISIDSSEQDIEKFYLNINKRKAVKSTNLETIFEETVDETLDDQDSSSSGSMNANGESSKTKLTGARKIKRSIAFNDGLNPNKALQTKRKNRVKKYFGSIKKKTKKISLANFMEYVQNTLRGIEDLKTDPRKKAELN